MLTVAVALVIGVVLTSCSGGRHATKKAKRVAATPTTTTPAVAPLTGLPDPSGASLTRAALTVKIDNRKEGQPKYGIDQADVVYEEIVEGATRLAAIFDSQAPERIGPVRSVRKTDQSIVWPIGGLFAYSGGAKYALDSIDTAPVVQLDETRARDGMFRDRSRKAPYNLYANATKLFARGGTPVPPPPLFTYRAPGAPLVGATVTSFVVPFVYGFDVTWTWDAPSGTWKRFYLNGPDTAGAGAQLAPQNVVVLFVDYLGGAGALQSEARLVGSGVAWVFTGGEVVRGRWDRPDRARPTRLLDAAGNEIGLSPGQTWVELPPAGATVTVSP